MIRKVKYIIPSMLTLGNLLCGFAAIASQEPKMVLLLVLAGALFDMFDGLSARLLKATSDFGKQLDSLADIITFGIAPAIAVFQTMDNTLLSLATASMIPVFSAIRLARFNIDAEKKNFFTGLPTPANGIFFAAIPFLMTPESDLLTAFPALKGMMEEQIWLSLIIIAFSFLMIIPLKMFSLKTLFQKSGYDQYFVAVLFLFTFPTYLNYGWAVAVPAGVLSYILLSVLYHFIKPVTTTTNEEKKDSDR